MKQKNLKILITTTLTVFMMLSFFCCTNVAISTTNNLNPLILIPGNGGNQLEAKLTTQYKPSTLICDPWYPPFKKKNGWFRLWFDTSVLLAPFTKCFASRMTLYYDKQLDDYFNAPGVLTRVPRFGSTYSLMYLDPSLKVVTDYMAPLVESLEHLGYIDGENLFGAPYDFRYGLAAPGHPSRVGSKFLNDLKNLIEEAALSAPWGGTVDEMFTFASGNSLGVPLVNPLLVRNEQRSSESNLWLLPNPKMFDVDKPLVTTPSRSYSAHDMVDFLKDIGYPEGVYPYETRILPLIAKIEAPEVDITCIVGEGVRTPEELFYRNGDFDEPPEFLYGDGDGTVNMVSLLALEKLWKDEKNQYLKVIKIGGVSHTSILKDKVAVDEIIGEISRLNSNVQLGLSNTSFAITDVK
ncbi:unnamed protein product [Vicia faba]|uniref:Uncharacterized protein n=1 Tax=Vicia faba TaxID=3906 RepID=A0AAV0ZL13_VICFA|nr:unnamed protein product [Vicia faba]